MQRRLGMSKQGKDGGKEINLKPLLTHAITDPKTGAWVLCTKRKQVIPGLSVPPGTCLNVPLLYGYIVRM